VTDWGTNNVSEWTRPGDHSQVSAEITLDGRRITTSQSVCQNADLLDHAGMEPCGITVSPGSHEVVVKATDGLGSTTARTLNIKVGDATKPNLEVGGELAEAPEGWIEQAEGNYGLHASATDAGYGVTSLNFSLDGKAVASKTQSCPVGSCSASISTTVNAHGLAAGAHPAEIVATDGAGNSTTKKWTVNVDPEGEISVDEAEATVEALEGTAPVNLIGESEAEGIEGTAPGLGVEEGEGQIQATGASVSV
jgi:hypothetical protein